MSARRSGRVRARCLAWGLAWIGAFASSLGGAVASAQEVSDLNRAWAAFDAGAPEDHDADREALLASGALADVAFAGFSTFADASPRGRRERASIAREHADARAIPAALLGLDDPDAEVREALVRFLGDRRLLGELGAERADALAEVARLDVVESVRRAAVDALAELDHPRALARLDALIDELVGFERRRAASLFAEHAQARERVVRRVQEAFTEDRVANVQGLALARLLNEYGTALVHVPGGGETAAERHPLIAGRRDASPAVRLAASQALDSLVFGLARQGELDRAERILDALRVEGIEPREIAYRRANLALTNGADATPARAGAAAILAEVRGSADPIDREWRIRGAFLAAAAEIALTPREGDAAQLARARDFLAEARATIEGRLSDRQELLSTDLRPARGNDEERAIIAHWDCLVDLWLAVVALAEGKPPSDPVVLAELRAMHIRQLKAQALCDASGARVDLSGFQPLLDDTMGPMRLLLMNAQSALWPAARAHAVQGDLARALAGVSAFEMPGFDPASDLAAMWDPLADPERKRLLLDVLQSQRDGAIREHAEERDRDHPDEDKLERLALSVRILFNDLTRVQGGEDGILKKTRSPSNFAYDLTLRWIEEGNSAGARGLAQRMIDDLFAVGAQGGVGVSEPMIALLEAAIGSAYMDDDDPVEAERAFRKAAERLSAYEESLEARITAEGGDPELQNSIRLARSRARSQRADVLLSLAVNANVRHDDQEAALVFFEQAFELKQNDFMRVLLACYRARSGRGEEARAVLREVTPQPSLYYNLACTHALLGEHDVAIDYLERELLENHPSERARARQAEWAREDPDLESLRSHPRFARLVSGS